MVDFSTIKPNDFQERLFYEAGGWLLIGRARKQPSYVYKYGQRGDGHTLGALMLGKVCGELGLSAVVVLRDIDGATYENAIGPRAFALARHSSCLVGQMYDVVIVDGWSTLSRRAGVHALDARASARKLFVGLQ